MKNKQKEWHTATKPLKFYVEKVDVKKNVHGDLVRNT
jgi:hypothetical protein